ncbi:GDP-mannose 4,6-dehydratase [Patescibacteria group bacterium]|nr:GDP-mannose 4,6-dehydratase [Patescibacteria group bacterium]
MKTAIITGITSQDGAYLAKLLLKKNYKVIGLLRHRNNSNFKKSARNLEYLGVVPKIKFAVCDLLDLSSITKIIKKYEPDEIYNLAAQSSVGISFNKPLETLSFNILSVANILEIIKKNKKMIKFYQASSSEMFGTVNSLPFTENSILHPVSPYGISKATAHLITINYREAYGLFAVSGILFNHESIFRRDDFIIKKIIKSAINIKKGKQKALEVGNIDIKRDFGYAPKYVEAIYLMMQNDKPDDYIICSGKSISLREIIYYVFDRLRISKEKIIIKKSLFRATEIKDIYGNPEKARIELNWTYEMSFYKVLDILIDEFSNNTNFIR